jgi:hypothetical protein
LELCFKTLTIEKAETIISLRLRNPLHDLCIDYATVKKTNRQVGKQTAAAAAMEREVRFPGRLPDEKLDENHLIVVVWTGQNPIQDIADWSLASCRVTRIVLQGEETILERKKKEEEEEAV